MVLAIPGGQGLFSHLQSVLLHATNPKPSDRLCLPQCVHDQLNDIWWIANSLNAQPTRWAEIVDSSPAFIGTVDASGLGMGGTWISCTHAAPLLWHHRFDATISNRLVSTDNPTGLLTNLDLEQLALTCHPDILTDNHDVREETICALSDNAAAISRERRGSTSSNSPSAYLCCISSIHQRARRYRLRVNYLPGPLNVMADDLSRRWDLSDSQLLAHFNAHYPQDLPWKLCQMRPEMSSSTIQSLFMKHCNPDYLMGGEPQHRPTGASGNVLSTI
jgi:hypothetical protein